MDIENTDDTFSKAFDELAKLGDTPADPAPEPAQAATPAEPAASGEPAQQDAEPAAAADAAVGEQPDPAGEPEAPVDEPEAPAKPEPSPSDDVLKRFADLLDRQQQAQEAKPEPQQQPEPAPELFSPEEVTQLEAFEKDWPDVAQSVRTIMRANQQVLAQHVFAEVGKFLRPHLETLETLAGRVHYSELTQAVPEYDSLRDKVVAWATSDSQPKYLRDAYRSVIEHGDLDEIKHLIQTYEAATGQSVKPASPAPVKAPELPPAAKQAAKSLAPVSAKRSAPSVQEDPTDFDSAFDKFLSEV